MLKYFVPLSLALGTALIWAAGCQSEQNTAMPSAASVKTEVTPRLNAATYFAHGHLLERQADYVGAVEQYQRALALSPKMTSARNRLGITLNKLGRHAEASAQFRLAIEQKPTDGYLQNNLGFSLYLEGKYAEALSALSAALELQPDYTRAHMNKGIVLAKTGDYAAALTEFTLTSGEADAHYNLGVIQSELGDYAAAAHSLESALQTNPEFEAARQQLHVVSRLAAGAEMPLLENPTAIVTAEPDAPSAPAEPLPAQALVADTGTPVRAAADSEGSQVATADHPAPRVADGTVCDNQDGNSRLARHARHRRPAQPAGPQVPAGSAAHRAPKPQVAQKPRTAYEQAQCDLKSKIIRRVVMAKLEQASWQGATDVTAPKP